MPFGALSVRGDNEFEDLANGLEASAGAAVRGVKSIRSILKFVVKLSRGSQAIDCPSGQ